MHGKCPFTRELIHSYRADFDRRALIDDRTYVQVADDMKIIGYQPCIKPWLYGMQGHSQHHRTLWNSIRTH